MKVKVTPKKNGNSQTVFELDIRNDLDQPADLDSLSFEDLETVGRHLYGFSYEWKAFDGRKCEGCGEPATRMCREQDGLTCGSPLCTECQHVRGFTLTAGTHKKSSPQTT